MPHLIPRILVTTALITATSFTAFAGSSFDARSPMLDKMDANKDGLIQRAEMTAFSDQNFAQMDADGNGLVTNDEKTAFRADMRKMRTAEKFDRMDADSDGFISSAEFMAAQEQRQQRRAARMDVNGDGTFDRADKKERRAKMKERRKEMRAQRKKMRAEHGKRIKPDANGDGMINLAEHQAATLARFKRMDKNDDGVLAADEQRKPKGARGGRHGRQH